MSQYQSPINALFAQLPQLAMQMYQGSREDKYRDKEMQFQKNNALFSQGIQTRNADIAEDNAAAEAIYRQTMLKNAGEEAENTANYRSSTLDQNNDNIKFEQDRLTNMDNALGKYITNRINFDNSIAPSVNLYNEETGDWNTELNTMPISRNNYMSQFKDYVGDDWDTIKNVAGQNLPNDYGAYSAGYGTNLLRGAKEEYTNEYKNLIKDPEQYKQLMSRIFGANLAETGYQVAPNMFTAPGEFPVDTPIGDLLKGVFEKQIDFFDNEYKSTEEKNDNDKRVYRMRTFSG